jgi:catechol 2,3-dioxygenase-like lactoylglutathione lyase family enzyme
VADAPIVNTQKGLHACIAVSDLDAGVDWYRRVLGFQLLQRHDYTEYGVRVVYLEYQGIELELVETLNPKSSHRGNPPAEHLALLGISQLSFRVGDMETAIQQLKGQGVELVFGPIEAPEFKLKACFIHDYEGNLLEFIERI